jgi:hypothetical protein
VFVAAAVTGGSLVRSAAVTGGSYNEDSGQLPNLDAPSRFGNSRSSEYLLLVQNILFAITAYLAVAHSTCAELPLSIVLRPAGSIRRA